MNKNWENGQHPQLVPELWLVPAVGCDRNHFTILQLQLGTDQNEKFPDMAMGQN